jgi:hypothetical protein
MVEIPEAAHRARQMYAEGNSIAAIKAETELSGHAVYFWLDGGPVVDGKLLLKPIERRVVRPRNITAGDRLSMIARIMRGCDRQITEIEGRINPSPSQMDQDARRLAMISRTLNELTAIDERNREMKRKKVPQENGKSRTDQPVPRSTEELRRSLVRKLESIIAERASEIPLDT